MPITFDHYLILVLDLEQEASKKQDSNNGITSAEDKTKHEDTNENLYCLVRQFDIEKPVNPSTYTYCDIASC